MKQTAINCPCGYGNNLSPDDKTCPICGLNLEPLHRIHGLPEEYFKKGKACFEQKNYEKAKQYFLTCQSLYGEPDSDLLEYTGRSYLETGDFPNAEKYLKSADELNTDNQNIKSILSQLQRKIISKNVSHWIVTCLLIIVPVCCLILVLSLGKSKNEIGRLEKEIGAKNVVINQQSALAVKESLVTVKNDSNYLIYHVRKGETLSLISYSIYGTDQKWEKIFIANKGKINDPDILAETSSILIPLDSTIVRH
jgi:tetratricopeptide (TPR) repeat protein